jgi:leucyl aminopeptidase
LKEQLKSDIADTKNTGDRFGGAITAALFLSEFVGDTSWVHLDIAGPIWSKKDSGAFAKGGTGVMVATLIELLS